jgi:uncharacterized protein with von Willebrand factor type A (vWA) domain
MSTPDRLGGIIHTYQKYDPVNLPSPTQPPPDLVSPAFEHLLLYGNTRDLTEEELANAIHLDPSQIRGLGPSLQAMIEMLKERKRKILETYETQQVQKEAKQTFEQKAGDKYQVDELASKYEFTGRRPMTVPEALEVKEELETIDKLLKQLEEAKKTAQVGIIDIEELQQFVDEATLNDLRALQQQVEDYVREEARRQGIEGNSRKGFELTPKAYRLFQSKVLTTIFSEMQASRTGRHPDPVAGEGAVETQRTKPYEFGDSVTHMDIPASFTNALLRGGPGVPVRMKPEDIEIHRTRNNPKAATVVLLDMSGSMRYDALYANVKRMGLALDGLIRSEYPGDYLQFVEMYTFAKPRPVAEVAALMPKPVTVHNSVVRLKADMSDPDVSELMVPHHFTNIQHGLQMARRFLSVQDTPNRQVVVITDGLPTAHFEGSILYMLYPPDPRTEAATMREAKLCARDGITINMFLLSNWNQSHEDVRFAQRVVQATKGRVIFTAGRELDRYVVWDYIKRRKSIIG